MEILGILKKLINCKSITPNDDGAIQFCSDFLDKIGFQTQILNFHNVKNLYAKFGNFDKNICFAGHVDVVSPLEGWHSDPFTLDIRAGKAYGRGANDMKGPLSACLLAISESINSLSNNLSISVLLTSDEELMGNFGTKSVVEYLKKHSEKIDLCVLCESSSPAGVAEYIKIGCRGSLNIKLTSTGEQCHVVMAPIIGNHMHNLVKILNELCNTPLDMGNEKFEPSSLQITSIDSFQNMVRNIVPPLAEVFLNIRFNDNWTFNSLEKYIASKTKKLKVEFERFGSPFIGCSDMVARKLQTIIEGVIRKKPQIGTRGGNSDALFLKEITNVVEVGSALSEAHIVDEYIKLEDLETLKRVYTEIIKNAPYLI